MILTNKGLQEIESIQVGDFVWAYDEKSQTSALKQVSQIYESQAFELVYIKILDEEIICTSEHPFYSSMDGWVSAIDLNVGDALICIDGSNVTVLKKEIIYLTNPIKVYNIEVQDYYTYYVGQHGVLVHNTCDVTSSIKNSNSLIREASKLNGRLQQEADNLIQAFLNGNVNPGIGTKHLIEDIYYLRGRNGARVFFRMVDGTMEILGKATKANEQTVIDLIIKLYV